MSLDIFADASLLPDIKSDKSLSSLLKEIKSADAEVAKEFEERVNEIHRYTALAESPQDLHNESTRVVLLSKLLYGFRKAGEATAWILIHKKNAAKRTKAAESIAAIDEFGSWCSQKRTEDKSFKPTADMRKYYSQMSDTLLKANHFEAAVDGMTEYLFNLKFELKEAISSFRSMMYGQRDSSVAGWGSSGHREE